MDLDTKNLYNCVKTWKFSGKLAIVLFEYYKLF